MKICLLNNLFKPLQRGGAERVTEIIAQGLRDVGHEVFVVTTKPHFGFVDDFKSDFKIYRLSSFYYNLNKIPTFLRLFWHMADMIDFFTYFKVKEIIKKEKPDFIISGNLKGLSFLLPILFQRSHIKYCHILHDIQLLHPSGLMFLGEEKKLDSTFSQIYQKINQRLFRDADMIVSPSSWLMEMHSQIGFFKNSKKIILPNPIVIKEKVKENPDSKMKSKFFTFLFVGHLTRAKGIEVILEAFKDLVTETSSRELKLILAGGGKLDRKYDNLVKSGAVEVLGFVDSRRIKELMSSSDFLVLPSLCYENSPTVLYEAALYGLPFVVSDLGGSRELAEKFYGQIFKPDNKNSLLSSMSAATKKPSLKDDFVKNNSITIKNYSIEEYVKKLLKNIF